MTVKVGDKVVVTTEKYSHSCPRGAVCTVVRCYGHFGIGATIDGGDGFNWTLKLGEYEPIAQPTQPDYDYAAQAAQHGICITVELSDGDVVVFDGRK